MTAKQAKDVRIVYVDDEETLALLGEEFLGDMGYQVSSCFSAAEALNLLKDDPQNYDLLVTDESMPEMSGIELAQKLYELAPQIPVILCSGHLLTMAEEGMERTNIKAVLVKTDVCIKLPDLIEEVLQ